jgi:alkaline phosphatase
MIAKLTPLFIASILLCGCDSDNEVAETVEIEEVAQEIEETPTVKNVILMIGDGMGPQQVGLLEEYAIRAPNSIYNDKSNKTALSKLSKDGHVGISLNAPYGNTGSLVTDSACSATQLATGKPAGSEMIGLDEKGNIVETILEKAKNAGKSTGLVSDTRLTHATPASFASHQPHRSLEPAIAVDMISSGMVDVMLSGGARALLPSDIKSNEAKRQVMKDLGAPESLYKKSKRKDERNILLEARDEYGYSLAFDNAQLAESEATKLLGIFSNSGMANGIAYKACKKDNTCTQPSLKDMTIKALDILSKDEDGFFLMIEGGQIDWAGHANDAGWMLSELIKFDEAVEAVYEWVKDRNDTLVVVTADHETGSFGLSYSIKDIPEAQMLDGDGMNGQEYHPNFNFGSLDKLDRLYAQTGTYYDMLSHVNSDWDFSDTNGHEWAEAINLYSDFKITPDRASPIAERHVNEYHDPDHKILSQEIFPKINDYKEFYVYGNEIHANLIARALGEDQNIVWGTGTHTAAPVPVIAFGPENITKQFSSIQHHIYVSQTMMTALGLEI